MKTILKDHACYVDVGTVETEIAGETKNLPKPRLVMLAGKVAYRNFSSAGIPVQALLDTGNDVTILKPQKLREIEKSLGFRLPLQAKIRYYENAELQPTFDLAFIFPGDHAYFSTFGIVTPRGWNFDVADMWLGQDLLNQLQVTYDGVNRTVTVVDPNPMSSGTSA